MQSATKKRTVRLGLAGLALVVGGLSLAPAAAGAANSDSHPRHKQLTDEQKTCLEGQGVTKPEKGTKPTDEQREAFKAAAESCGIELPARGNRPHRPKLTDEQKTCLEGQGVTKPEKGTKPTAEQREAFKAAAESCGIELPARPTA